MLAFCEKQRDLRKFRCPWFEISLPVVSYNDGRGLS